MVDEMTGGCGGEEGRGGRREEEQRQGKQSRFKAMVRRHRRGMTIKRRGQLLNVQYMYTHVHEAYLHNQTIHF